MESIESSVATVALTRALQKVLAFDSVVAREQAVVDVVEKVIAQALAFEEECLDVASGMWPEAAAAVSKRHLEVESNELPVVGRETFLAVGVEVVRVVVVVVGAGVSVIQLAFVATLPKVCGLVLEVGRVAGQEVAAETAPG